MLRKITLTDSSGTTIFIRLMVGGVFLSEGIQKFLFPEMLGSGRFQKIGIPYPEFFGPLGTFEVLCGILILIGLFTRLATVPLIIIIIVAIASTKVNSFIANGLWDTLHGSRTDWAMLLGSIFLLIRGGGKYSIDKKITSDV